MEEENKSRGRVDEMKEEDDTFPDLHFILIYPLNKYNKNNIQGGYETCLWEDKAWSQANSQWI